MKISLLWQKSDYLERDWILELFQPYCDRQIFDGEHRVVLDRCLLIDSYLHDRPREYYAQFRNTDAWLLHLGDETYEGGYEVYDNFRAVFRCYWSGFFNSERVLQIPLGYAAGLTRQRIECGTEKRAYVWSFLGSARRSSRPEMIGALKEVTPHFAHVTDQGNVARIGKREYEQILRQSIFVPCPMGNVNLECYRIYEALEFGAIPILEKRIGFDYFARLLGDHPLPTFVTWKQAASFLRDVQNDQHALDALQKTTTHWWSAFKTELGSRIGKLLAMPAGTWTGGAVRWQRAIPGSQAFELMRHHSSQALARRMKLQFQRLVSGNKLRKTTGA